MIESEMNVDKPLKTLPKQPSPMSWIKVRDSRDKIGTSGDA